jgi:hypothetical protein
MQKKRKKEKRRNCKMNPPWKKKKEIKKITRADNLFAEPCWNVPKPKYPSTKYNDVIVDNCCMHQQFDAVLHCGQFL